ncbi:MAG: hypothetical protein AAGM22_12235 [Acidobacteriota bacterium]
MSTPERPVRDVQDECALIAAELENLIQRLVRVRESLRLPPDTLALYENQDVAWPLELELDASMGTAVDEELEPAAIRLRKAARLNAERLRQAVLAKRLPPKPRATAELEEAKGTS